MRWVDPSYEIIPQEEGLLGVYKQIEKAARTAYKSEDRITEGSAQKMVESLCKSSHGACLEHGTIYLEVPYDTKRDCLINGYSIYSADHVIPRIDAQYASNPYSKVHFNPEKQVAAITTNARVIFENGWEDDLKYMCEPTEFHEKRVTVKFITSIGIVREILRHRHFSFLNESTRYCNYSKGKFNEELTFIIPQWIYNCRDEWAPTTKWPGEKLDYLYDYSGEKLIHHLTAIDRTVAAYYDLFEKIESEYLFDVTEPDGYKLKAEEARGMLPLDLKRELIVTGFVSDWIHFFRLRSHIAATGKPHPDIQILADPLMEDFIYKNYCTYEQIKEGN